MPEGREKDLFGESKKAHEGLRIVGRGTEGNERGEDVLEERTEKREKIRKEDTLEENLRLRSALRRDGEREKSLGHRLGARKKLEMGSKRSLQEYSVRRKEEGRATMKNKKEKNI